MRNATVRQVQHNLASVLRWVEDGEEVTVSRRGRIVAKIVPVSPDAARPDWPDFTARAREVWGGRLRGKPLSQIIVEDREERF